MCVRGGKLENGLGRGRGDRGMGMFFVNGKGKERMDGWMEGLAW